jgi:hypothetical protein
MIEMRKEGRAIPQYVVSDRDYKYLLSEGWEAVKPAPVILGTTELIQEPKRKPGRPKKGEK